MDNITGVTRGGAEWTPKFVSALEQANCIGCGRCYKVCPRDVFELIEREMSADAEELDEDDDDFSDDSSMVMSIANAMDCIGCQACSKVCPKDCHTHEAAAIAA